MTLLFLSMTSPTKFYHVIQNILYLWSCHKSFVTLAFYERSFHNLNFINIRPEKSISLIGALGSEPQGTSEVNSSVLPIQGQ